MTLSAAAPAGGTAVTLTSSLIELAASVPTVTVAAGQTTASFIIATNAHYRRYSGLPFNVIISATHVATANATLTVTAQPMPPDFNSGSTAGANTQWSGLMCGGIAPIGGDLDILYTCSPAPSDTAGFGSCTFRQECPIGCRRVPPSGGAFNDFCATTGPNPISISRNYIISGDRVPTTLEAEAPVARPTRGVLVQRSLQARSFSRADVGGIPFPTGATSVPFEVATSYVPSPEFVDVGGFWFDDSIPPLLITSGRGGQAWIAMVPPDPPPALPIPTFVDFGIHGVNLGGITVSGFSAGGGPTVSLTSSHPDIVLGPASVVVNSSHVSGNQVEIFTQPPAVETAVTITATDGRYTASGVMTVPPPAAPSPPPAVAVSVNPSGVEGGSSATGTVTLGAPQTFNPDGTVVTLASSNPAVATVPASVTVPAGTATTANFTVTTSSVPASTSVIITADCCNLRATTSISVTAAAPPPAPPLALALNPASVAGGTSSTGTVTLNAAAPAGGALVKLSSSNAAARVPVSVTVPAGATSASFAIATSSVAILTTATIAAVFNSHVWNAVLAVNPPGAQAATLAAIMLNPATVPAGASSTGTVTLNVAAPAGGAVVTLSSYRTSATVPASVTVAPGARSASFTVTTNSASHPGTITISAAFAGVTRVAELMTTVPTDPNAALATFTLGQTSVTGGTIVSATVTLTGPAPSSGAGGAEIDVTSSNTAVARIPPGVIVGTGNTSADFSIITSSVPASTPVTLTASFGGVTVSRVLTVNPQGTPAPTLSAVSLNPTSVVGGNSSTGTGTVRLTSAAPSGGAVVSLSDNSTAASTPASVTVAAGSTSRNFTVTTTTVTSSTSVTFSAVYAGVTRTAALTVNPPSAPSAPSLVSPATGATVAQPVTLDWNNVTTATSYEVQVDNSSTIAAPFIANLTGVTVSQTTLGEVPAQQLWWRVRARNAAGVFGPFSSTRRFTPQGTAGPASLSSVSVNPASVGGGTGSTGMVTLTSGAPAGGAVVFLSSNTAVVGVPASVPVAAGATGATFAATTSSVASSTPGTITATYNSVARTATLTVNPPGQAATLSVTASGRSGERVTSSPAGISVNVGTTGSASFATGTSIRLSVTNGRDAVWSGACSSGGSKTETCTFTLNANGAVTANVQ